MVAKPWGRDRLPAPFVAPAGERIGEVWFEPPAALPQLLAKYIFTSEPLSVQVHPSAGAIARGGLPGEAKEECWLVIDAQPGARLGIGFTDPIAPGQIRAAALDGSIEHLLAWHTVVPGDFFYIPAGTVHAIGAGVGLIEVQQNSDTTYRLYDYGRLRELHLDAALAVVRGEPHPQGLRRQVPSGGAVTLVDGPLFRLDRLDGAPDPATAARYAGAPLLVLPLDAPARIAGETIEPGAAALAETLAAVSCDGRWLAAQPA